ncbi:MAG: hypothetical protein PW788_03250 [Micavibrio sp.]|nr:hypothetical protein [Micavibrio sp.]
MAKRVSADTITEITTSKAFFEPGQAVPSSVPTVEQLINDIRSQLASRLKTAEAADRNGTYNPDARPRQQSLAEAQKDRSDFEQIIKEIPAGFRLAPVLYNRISTDENATIKQEYSFKVRPSFMRFLANEHAAELKDLGICQHGIDRMAQGLDPANAQGEPYSVNVDHIIERAGSGKWGKTKSADDDQPAFGDTFNVNHFGNFMLLPEKIHEFKNALNDLQKASYTSVGNSKWILMMTPERNDLFSGFVCPKLEAGHRLAGLETRPYDDFKRIEHGQYILAVTLSKVDDMRKMGDVLNTVCDLIDRADSLQGKVAALAERERKDNGSSTFNQAFRDAVHKDGKVEDYVDNMVRPALKDVTDYVTTLFDRLTVHLDDQKQRAAFWEFAHFFRSPKMRDLRFDVEALPFEEASEMHEKFNMLNLKVTEVCDRLDAEGKAARRLRDQSNPANDDSFRNGFNGAGRNGGSNPRGQNDNRPHRGGPVTRDDFGRKQRTR